MLNAMAPEPPAPAWLDGSVLMSVITMFEYYRPVMRTVITSETTTWPNRRTRTGTEMNTLHACVLTGA